MNFSELEKLALKSLMLALVTQGTPKMLRSYGDPALKRWSFSEMHIFELGQLGPDKSSLHASLETLISPQAFRAAFQGGPHLRKNLGIPSRATLSCGRYPAELCSI